MKNLTMAMKTFNERVKTMNQSSSKQLILSADEARNLHSDLFSLLARLAEMQVKPEAEESTGTYTFDGGSFK